MNPETPKIVAAWLDYAGDHMLLPADGRFWYHSERDAADARLAQSGQRAIWPDGHGVAVIGDIPKPEPLPTAYLWRNTAGAVSWSVYAPIVSTLVATVTFDEDGTPHVERVAS